MVTNNLLSRLHRYASRQDENFVTEAFAYLLRHLLENEPNVAVRILSRLTGGILNASADQASSITVTTQVATEQGRPDLEISTLDSLIYVEAKVDSELGDRQLERYREELQKQAGFAYRGLVLLSRYPVSVPHSVAGLVVSRRWYQVADWLLDELQGGSLGSDVSRFLVVQFTDFLTQRGVTMEAVGWQLVEGMKAFRGLLGLVQEALAALKITFQKTNGWESINFYLDAKNFWVGMSYDRPGILIFSTLLSPVGSDGVEKAGFGRVEPEGNSPTGIKWVNELVLYSEDVHFFARSRASQLQCIEQFLKDSLAAAQRARPVSDQP
ncbi:PD-(D/E)XK nuclease family protein [Paludisphaera soli]|uniref:PD-(D/E)XK nuclease family protein n=1 Tax=Paludisphaera soli TaxID=2712865 RepID=UPI0013EB0F7C|nr:PD-(D/E)XK nuclease family protein [Paludisphaera soli]